MPIQIIIDRLNEEGFVKIGHDGRIITSAKVKWIQYDHRSTLIQFNALSRGLLNYYSMAVNISQFRYIINYILHVPRKKV